MPPQKVSDRSDVGDCDVSGDYSEDDADAHCCRKAGVGTILNSLND